jgi:hypothetical protein
MLEVLLDPARVDVLLVRDRLGLRGRRLTGAPWSGPVWPGDIPSEPECWWLTRPRTPGSQFSRTYAARSSGSVASLLARYGDW